MSDYVMNQNNRFSNFVSIKLRSFPNSYTCKGRAKESSRRFLQAAATLPEGECLGWETAVDQAGVLSNTVFSSSGIDVSAEDYAWIFEPSAAVIPRTSAGADYFWQDRQVYALSHIVAETKDEDFYEFVEYDARKVV